VYGIVKQNHGFVDVHSKPGVGTSFRFYFPAVMEKAEKISRRVISEFPRGTETVLLVEDEDMVRGFAKRILQRQGYTVIEAPDGGKAYTVCKKHSGEIHLLLTDVIMPKMNGRELHKKLLAIKPGLKVLFMSGYPENIIAHHGVLDESTQFIGKPFNIEELTGKVREVLDY